MTRISVHRRIILRRLGPLVHAVVAHDLEDAKIPGRRIGKQLRAEFDAGLMIRQIDQEREVAVTIDALEGIWRHWVCTGSGALRFHRKNISRLAPCRIVVGRAPLGLPDRLSRPCFVDQLGDANAVIRKDLLATDRLHLMMVGMSPPGRQSPLVLPYLIGQQQILPRQTPEAIDEQAAAHGLKRRLQRSGELQILIPVAGPRLNLKEQTNHRISPRLLSAPRLA